MVIHGFRIGSTDLSDVDMELGRCRASLEKVTAKVYHRLLGEEAAFLCDCVSLGILQRPVGASIYSSAVSNTDRRVQRAGATGVKNKYNLNVYANVMPYKGATFISIICGNTRLLKAFSTLEPYSLTEEECQDTNNKKYITWQKIHGIYEKEIPFSKNLTCAVSPDISKLVFPDVKTRCHSFANQNTMNLLLRDISMGENVEPFLLMRYMESVLDQMVAPDMTCRIRQREMELQQILLDFSDQENLDVLFAVQGDGAQIMAGDGQGDSAGVQGIH